MKKIAIVILIIAIVPVAIILFRTYSQPDLQPEVTGEIPAEYKVPTQIAEHLAKAVSFPTISHHPAMMDTTVFNEFHRWLMETFPGTYSALEVDTISTHSLVFHWRGKSSEHPILFMAHQDVVPVDESIPWEHPAFGSEPTAEFVYGRGTLDDKGAMISILEAVEKLVSLDFQPEHDVYFAFGQDEEIGGENGAVVIAKHFAELGLRFDMVLDEGGIISDGIIPGIDKPVALLGTAEKGYVSVDVECATEGGHSSMPGDTTALTVAAEVIRRMEEHPFESRLCQTMDGFLGYLGPHFSFVNRMASANRWAFESVIINAYSAKPSGAALVHTTCTPTIVQGGIKDNVIPQRAVVTFNSRILPGETAETVLSHYRENFEGLPVTLSIHDEFAEDPSPESDYNGEAFKRLASVVKRNFPDFYVAPYLMLGASDGRHMTKLSDNVFRFIPFRFEQDDLGRLHGLNERVRVEDLHSAVTFYMDAIRDLSSSK